MLTGSFPPSPLLTRWAILPSRIKNLTGEKEVTVRRKLVEKALKALTTEVEDQTVFED